MRSDGNSLTGTIPASIGDLTKLKVFNFGMFSSIRECIYSYYLMAHLNVVCFVPFSGYNGLDGEPYSYIS